MEVKRGPILFRCDGTQEGGWESLYQCLSFAAALQRRRRGTHFFSYLDPLSLAHVINRANNDWTAAEHQVGVGNDVGVTVNLVRKLGAAAVVVCGDHVTPDYLEELRAAKAFVLVFDSKAGTVIPSDLVVNPFLAPPKKSFQVKVGGQILVGRKYALVRGVFRRQRTIRATEQPAPFRAMVAFGDDDAGDQTLMRTEQLMQIPKVEKISILARYHHPRFDEIKEFCANSGGRVEVITESKEMMTRLVRSHFALTGGDTWSLEMCCTGLPQLAISHGAKHTANAKRMDDEGMATFIGESSKVTFDGLKEAVDTLLDDPMERLSMSRCARNLVDGRGGDRIVNGMEIMLHTPARALPFVAKAA
ncbi:PseG/SpsG family protein [Limnoglobus roseus]|uniref:Polysaccharide biosynthesis protein n=1 Tax=Limnoglobus roseus TaxID=2598579 RepID=A0A5C1A5R0_9BACT|nr:polysaccharide biosynthesis protein [Limnoglobus roseus]QEL14499.1 polysaccharide biosynthesis protein [Limnoglobus roseus]